MLDALNVAHFFTGRTAEAIRYGQRALTLRDAEACHNPPNVAVTDPSGPPSGDNVISFSLWGRIPFYGAMINLVLSRTVYPGWTYVSMLMRPCRGPASPICATTAPMCAISRTNIRAPACSSVSW